MAALSERRGESARQVGDLAVNNDGVDALLAAEVLVHHGLRDLRAGGDLLDRGAVEPLLGKEFAADPDQLLAALGTGHSDGTAWL